MPPLKASRRPKKPRNPRKRSWPRGLKTAIRLGLPVTVAAALAGGALWLSLTSDGQRLAGGVLDRTVALSANAGLRVKTIVISGRARIPQSALEDATQARRGMPILAFDPHRAKQRLEMLAWVRAATVERRLPDTLVIRVHERQPLALWQFKGQMSLIDTEGVVITRWKLGRYWKLPLVVGDGAPEQAFAMIRELQGHPRLNKRIKALVRVSARRWDLRFKNGVVARLPEKDAARALATLDRLHRRERLLDRDIVAVDLRFKDRLVVRTKARPKAKPKAGNSKSKARGRTHRAAQGKDT